MTKMLAIIDIPEKLSHEQLSMARAEAESRLGPEFRVLVLSGGTTCKVVPIFDGKAD